MAEQHHSHDHDHDSNGRCRPRGEHDSKNDYEKHGIRFQFPSSWNLVEQSDEEETTISVHSDGTSFWTVVLFPSRPDPDEVLDTVVQAFELDYEEVDVLSHVGSLCGLPTLGRDLDFVCYDLVNSAILRAFQTSDKTVLVLFQGTDHELETTRPQLEAITASFQCDDEDALDEELI